MIQTPWFGLALHSSDALPSRIVHLLFAARNYWKPENSIEINIPLVKAGQTGGRRVWGLLGFYMSLILQSLFFLSFWQFCSSFRVCELFCQQHQSACWPHAGCRFISVQQFLLASSVTSAHEYAHAYDCVCVCVCVWMQGIVFCCLYCWSLLFHLISTGFCLLLEGDDKCSLKPFSTFSSSSSMSSLCCSQPNRLLDLPILADNRHF